MWKTGNYSTYELQQMLVRTHGVVVGGRELTRLLAYPSQEAFRQAQSRGVLPVHVFSIPHRKGKFAYAQDIAAWIANLTTSQGG